MSNCSYHLFENEFIYSERVRFRFVSTVYAGGADRHAAKSRISQISNRIIFVDEMLLNWFSLSVVNETLKCGNTRRWSSWFLRSTSSTNKKS